MKTSSAILSSGWSAALVAISVIFSCVENGGSAPAPGIVCPSNLAEILKEALQNCQKESKALEEEEESVTLPEKPAVGALSRDVHALPEQRLRRGADRVRRFDRGVTVFSPVTQQQQQDQESDDDDDESASSGKPTTKSGRVRRAVTEAEERKRRGVSEAAAEVGLTLPSLNRKEEEEERSRRAAGIVAVAGKHHRKDDDCDLDYGYRRRRQVEQKTGGMMSCAANKLVSEQPFLQKAIEACKDMDLGSASEEESEQMTAFEECFKTNVKEMCPDMPIVE